MKHLLSLPISIVSALLVSLVTDFASAQPAPNSQSIVETSGSFDSKLQLALSLHSQGKYTELVKLISPYAASKDPEVLKEVCLLLGMAYESLKDYDEMISLYEDCIKHGKRVSYYYEPLSKAYAAKGDFKKAYESLAQYTEAISASIQIEVLKKQRDSIEKDSVPNEMNREVKASIDSEISRLEKSLK